MTILQPETLTFEQITDLISWFADNHANSSDLGAHLQSRIRTADVTRTECMMEAITFGRIDSCKQSGDKIPICNG